MKCENCKNYYSEEENEGTIYHYCDIFKCGLWEIAGLDTEIGCIYYEKKENENAV